LANFHQHWLLPCRDTPGRLADFLLKILEGAGGAFQRTGGEPAGSQGPDFGAKVRIIGRQVLGELGDLDGDNGAQSTEHTQHEDDGEDDRGNPPNAPLPQAANEWRQDEGEQGGDHQRLEDRPANV
jgi:hypothetical protein